MRGLEKSWNGRTHPQNEGGHPGDWDALAALAGRAEARPLQRRAEARALQRRRPYLQRGPYDGGRYSGGAIRGTGEGRNESKMQVLGYLGPRGSICYIVECARFAVVAT